MIRFENIEIGYKTPLFSIDSLELELGNAYVLVGQNGAGKSTLFKTITKEIEARKGEIWINNKELKSINKLDIARLISFVPSRFPVLDFVTVEEFLGLGRTPHTNWIGKFKSSDVNSVEAVIKKLGIEHLKNKFTSDLSDGERQLVAIGRSLIQETPIIFLDEPTSFLDYKNKQKVIQFIKTIVKEDQKLIVFSSHDIELSIGNLEHFLCIHNKNKKLIQLQAPSLKEIVTITF